MTLENLERANELHRQIEEKKEFLNTFDSWGGNRIVAYAANKGPLAGSGETREIHLSVEPELSKMVRECLEKRISDLEKQLEEL